MGASGVLSTLRDFARVGELLLHKGKFNGKQLFPLDYMEKATSKRVESSLSGLRTNFSCGYGYQIWIEPNGYGAHGMNSNSLHCFPAKDLIIAYTAGVNNATEKEGLYNYANRIFKHSYSQPLAESEQGQQRLKDALDNMTLGRDYGEKYSSLEEKINNKKIVLQNNPMGIKWFKLVF